METLRFKKTNWMVVAIVIIIIIAIAIFALNASGKEGARQEEQAKPNKLARLIQSWLELVNRINIEVKVLRLTQEMEAMLERKIAGYIILAKLLFFTIFSFSVTLLYLNGVDIVTAILNTTGILGIVFFGGSLLIANRFAEPNAVVEAFIQWIRKSVYKKYGYDPAMIPILKESIEFDLLEAEQLNAIIQAEGKLE